MLLYHSISDDVLDPLAVSPSTFHRHMERLVSLGVSVISVTDFLTLRAAPGSIVITFDDGFEDFQTNALPVLREVGFPSVQFVTSSLVGTEAHWPTWNHARRFLDWGELDELAQGDVSIGSHAVNHVHLGQLNETDLAHEMIQSRYDLQKNMTHWLDVIAYPYGDHTAQVRAAARNAGYLAGFAAGGLWGNHRTTDRFAIRRYPVSGRDGPDQIERIVTGKADLEHVRSRLRS